MRRSQSVGSGDFVLGLGYPGPEAAIAFAAIRNGAPESPIIVLSQDDPPQTRRQALHEGAATLLAVPARGRGSGRRCSSSDRTAPGGSRPSDAPRRAGGRIWILSDRR